MAERLMKDSGASWIGNIPEKWEIGKIGQLYTERNTKCSDREYEPLSVTMKGVLPQLSTAAKTDAHDDRKLVKAGDFAINSRSDRRGSCGIAPQDGSVSLINIILKPRNNMHPGFYNWLFHSSMFSDEFYKWGHGIVDDLWTTRWQDMKSILVPVPTYDEQACIANFLDKKVSEIDSVISKTQQTIEEYKKLKQAIITEAVTKGLNPNVEMKDSGVLWYGLVPKKWRICTISSIATTCSGGTPKSDNPDYYDGDVMWACSFDLHEKEIWKTEKTITDLGASVIAGKTQKPGSILVAMYGGAGTIGNSGLLRVDARTNQAICSIYFDESIVIPEYAFYQIRYLRAYWMYFAEGTRKDPNISQETIRKMMFLVPSVNEQKQISDYLDKKCTQFDSLVESKERIINELEQYKKSLIYEYVTGKKEVVA